MRKKGRKSNELYFKQYDTDLLRFDMQKDIDRGSAQILSVNEKNRSLLPLDFELSDYGLTKWLKRRGITKYKGLVNMQP